MPTELYDTIILGAGCAGLAGAMYAGRLALKTLVIGESVGGTIILTDLVENYPGFKRLTGMELANKLKEHALEYGISMEEDRAEKVEKAGKNWRVHTLGGKSFESKTLIFALGTEWKKLGVPGEKEFANKGVHYCALCDGAFYKGKTVAIVGGSDSAAKDALVLAQYAKKVYILYRGEQIRAEPPNMRRVQAAQNIEVVPFTNVLKIDGDKFVRKVELDRAYNGSKTLPMDGVFVAIGHIPLSQLATAIGVKTNAKGEIVIDREAKTNLPGVFAAGDVVDTVFKQAITGVGEAVLAAYGAYMFVKENGEVLTANDPRYNGKNPKEMAHDEKKSAQEKLKR